MEAKSEVARVRDTYQAYAEEGRHGYRPGADSQQIRAERDVVLARMLSRHVPQFRQATFLEVGCGGGAGLFLFRRIGAAGTLVGVDIVSMGLDKAAEAAFVAEADGSRLPFPDDCFDVVALFTVFSSVLDLDIRKAIADEADRVGGAVLCYDLRVPSYNRNVRPVRLRDLRRLFPQRRIVSDTLTVLPPLARRLASHPKAYGALRRVPVMRTHRLTLLTT